MPLVKGSCYQIASLAQVKQITGTTADVFLEYTQRNLPEGVTMSVYQVRNRSFNLYQLSVFFNLGGT